MESSAPMMKLIKKYLNSISNKLKFAIVIWLLGALFFVGLTLNITWKLENRGIAINEAGSLRKQTYLMTTLLLSHQTQPLKQQIALFEKKLNHLQQLESQTSLLQNNALSLPQLNHVKEEFQQYQLKILAAQHDLKQQPNLLNDTASFIQSIDHLVTNIEQQNTLNIKIMRLAQTLLIFMVFLSAVISLFLLNHLIIRPLSTLNQGLKKITQGDLNTRLHIQTNDEFHHVSDGFNQMAESLQDAYQHLEEKVKQKTLDLEQRNFELSTLYEMTHFLHKNPYNKQTLNLFLEKIIALSQAGASSIRLLNQQGSQMWTSHSINVPDEILTNPACVETSACFCGNTLQKSDTRIFFQEHHQESLCKKLGMDHLMVYHIRLREQTLGILTLYFKNENSKDEHNHALIKLLCNQLAATIENERLILKEKQYAVLEERNIMAQGLHDSIAQSLSFMNMQFQMLNQAWKKNDQDKIEQHLVFLNTGLQQCYEDIRELLNNFRLKLAQESFHDVLISVIDRFKGQTHLPVTFHYQSTGADLTPQQQLQLIFILQEALSNIRKHAKASEITIHFRNHQNETYLFIEDNGVGFDTSMSKEHQGHHIGLSIMQERIQQIGGTLTIHSVLNQGTRIEATI